MSEELVEREPPEIPEWFQKAAAEAFGELAEKLASVGDIKKSDAPLPKSWFIDPMTVMDSMGMNYRTTPGPLTQEMLRLASERNVIVAACIKKRVEQTSIFARLQRNKYSMGFVIRPRGAESTRRLTPSDRDRIETISRFLLNTGLDYNIERDSFAEYLKKSVRDTLTYDGWATEKVKTYGDEMHSFFCVDAATIRIANPTNKKGTPPDVEDLRRTIRYCQILNGIKQREYTGDELAYLVRNPRSSVRTYRYGLPEIEILMNTITAHIWAEQYNQRQFAQGSTIPGLINIKGKIPQGQLELIRKQWQAMISGVQNAWRTPIVNAEGLDWIQLRGTNIEMGFQLWIEYLIKVTCSLYNMDPSEIGFDLRGGLGQQPMFMTNNEAQQKVSRDQGLSPLLRFLEDGINRHLVWPIDDRYEIAFLGLDAKTEEQAAQLRMQQVQNTHTLNEVRALEDLPPVPGGDIVLNPVYQGAMAQRAQMQVQQQQIAAQSAVDGGKPPEQVPSTHEDLAFQEEPGEAEKRGAERLAGAVEEKGTPVPGDEVRVLRRDDWTSSVHSALPRGELRKALVDLEEILEAS